MVLRGRDATHERPAIIKNIPTGITKKVMTVTIALRPGPATVPSSTVLIKNCMR